ncbi:MAG: DNA polymerase IV, partial [Hyphomicrobiaceae bacterium]
RYKAVSDEIRTIFLAATPIIEPVSLDEAYLDLSEEQRYEGPTAASALAHIALRVEREVCITVSIGLAPNKFLAKLASDLDKPRGFAVIGATEAATTLAAMPVKKIHGVGAVTAERMEALGLNTIADLQGRSEAELVGLFGSFGRRLAAYSQGQDERRVTPSRETKSISAEDTFSRNTAASDELCAAIVPMCVRLGSQLVRKRLSGRTVVVKLKTHDFKLISRHARLQHPTQKSELIYDAASKLIAREADGRMFRLVGVGLTDLADAEQADPPGLFDV